MTETITVRVMDADMARGRRRDAVSCPLALAFRREYPECADVAFGAFECWVSWVEGYETVYRLLDVARDWIAAFDQGTAEKPSGTIPLFMH